MALADLTDWIDEYSKPPAVWFVKRLAANDTLATHSHQAGPYIPKKVLLSVIPDLNRPRQNNPDFHFDLYIDSHAAHQKIRAIWYNSKLHGTGTRNETRLTGFGGISSALLDPDNTGSLAAFVFVPDSNGNMTCHVWVCDQEAQDDLFEDRIGIVEPKHFLIWTPGAIPSQGDLFAKAKRGHCWLSDGEIPSIWLENFPSGEAIIEKTMALRPAIGASPDVRLLQRRTCEYEIFRSVETAFWMPKVSKGFDSIDSFTGLAQTILQSRRSRAGKSLEYHARAIFCEEGLKPSTDFSYNPVLPGKKRPDFIFPSEEAYNDAGFPQSHLRMLAAKTTCKDRWRQILTEADRISKKHLLTLQEGVSENQFNEMLAHKVQLVVPSGLHRAYPETIRPHLMTLEEFIGDLRLLKTSH